MYCFPHDASHDIDTQCVIHNKVLPICIAAHMMLWYCTQCVIHNKELPMYCFPHDVMILYMYHNVLSLCYDIVHNVLICIADPTWCYDIVHNVLSITRCCQYVLLPTWCYDIVHNVLSITRCCQYVLLPHDVMILYTMCYP